MTSLTAPWRKSSYSTGTGGTCVEVQDGLATQTLVRDSKLGDRSPVLAFSPADWQKFVATVTR
jgi:hypothetical protein